MKRNNRGPYLQSAKLGSSKAALAVPDQSREQSFSVLLLPELGGVSPKKPVLKPVREMRSNKIVSQGRADLDAAHAVAERITRSIDNFK
jgi:hypothetical protein